LETDTELYNLEAEREILRALYLNPELFYQVDIKALDFYREEHRRLFETMLRIYADGLEIDLVSLKDYDPSCDILWAQRLFSEAITSANINYHSKILKENSFQRACLITVKELYTKVTDENFLSLAQEKILNLLEFGICKEPTTEEIFSGINADIAKVKEMNTYGIQTGFEKLNEACVGLCPGHLWMIGGYTSYGKSTLLSQLIADICDNDSKALIFSVEDSRRDKYLRITATLSDIPIRHIVRGLMDEFEQKTLIEAQKRILEYKLFIYDDVYTLEDMNLKIKKHMLKGGVDVVAIDYVQNLALKGDIYERMSTAARELQRMAKRHNICILALSQVTGGKLKEREVIGLKGAGELSEAADIVLWIDRKEIDHRGFNLIIRKNRPFGVTGKIPMSFNETWTNIFETSL
jgi:replicative DNA helicase